MRLNILLALAASALAPALIHALSANTDSIQDADPSQSGYLPFHHMDPNIITSPSFGILWTSQTLAKEKYYAKPLVYTTATEREIVITASSQNWVRIYDAATGEQIVERQVMSPFLQSDIGCYDIPDTIGITGTPIIDEQTDTLYLFAKGYRDGAALGGVGKGIYQMYALSIPTLEDVAGFPVLIDGNNADNDASRYFIGGTVLQRPALTALNGVVVAGFGGHCDMFNYTGYVVSVSKTAGVGVVGLYAMEAAPGAPSPQPLDIFEEKGGKAGIWHSGMGIATDNNRIFIVTGNGQGHANGAVPASGKLPLSTLDEVVASFEVSPEGKFRLLDYFEPYEYTSMDAGDRDLGSSGVCLLDADVFNGAGVTRIAVTVGKNAKVYVMNADNLGGFKQGLGGTDDILQTIGATNAVFGGVGSYPLEGGYFYFTPVGDVAYAYKFGTDSNGKPVFSLAGTTGDVKFAGRVGVGQPTITSHDGLPGTGILWITDVNTGLNAFRAVPNQQGILEQINLPATPGMNKFQRPVFGNGRVYVLASNKIYCLGHPVNLPLSCDGPVRFGSVVTGSIGTAEVTCTANIDITSVDGCVTDDALFQCANTSLPQGPVSAGTSFAVPLQWDLTGEEPVVDEAEGEVSFGMVLPGVKSTVLDLMTTNGVEGYSTTIPISLGGTVVSLDPYLHMSPAEVDFGGLVLLDDGNTQDGSVGLTSSAVMDNIGSGTLTFLGAGYRFVTGGSEDDEIVYTNVTFSPSDPSSSPFADLGHGFTSPDFPAPGSTLAGGSKLVISLSFTAATPGHYSVIVTVWSTGGVSSILLTASTGTQPVGSLSISNKPKISSSEQDADWVNIPFSSSSSPASSSISADFGTVLSSSDPVFKTLRLCNLGGSVLTITKSKPPVSAYLSARNPYGDFLEGQKIAPSDCAFADLVVYAPVLQPNRAPHPVTLSWILNTDGAAADGPSPSQPFGVRHIVVSVTLVSSQVGPLLSPLVGDEDLPRARYQWVGCFADTTPAGRNLGGQFNDGALQSTNSNGQCQNVCHERGMAFAGTQYHRECWCGNTIKHPDTYWNEDRDGKKCSFTCPGNIQEACGGDGGFEGIYADTTLFDIDAFHQSLRGEEEDDSSSSSSSNLGSTKITVSTTNTTPTTPTTTTTTTTSDTIHFPSNPTTTTSTTNPTSSSSPSSSSSSPSSPSLNLQDWTYIGCYLDLVSNIRTLNDAKTATDSMTATECAAFCSSESVSYNQQPFPYFGLEYGRECFCGYNLNLDPNDPSVTDLSVLLAPESDCNTPCAGDLAAGPARTICGSGKRLSVFRHMEAENLLPPPSPVHQPYANGYVWMGCYTEAEKGRALTGASKAEQGMTTGGCGQFCRAGGWMYAGVEYGRECYCGNEIGLGAVLTETGECKMLCDGDRLEFCGAGGRLDLYQWSGDIGSSSSSLVLSSTSTSISSSSSSSSGTNITTGSTVTTVDQSSGLSQESLESSTLEDSTSTQATITTSKDTTSLDDTTTSKDTTTITTSTSNLSSSSLTKLSISSTATSELTVTSTSNSISTEPPTSFSDASSTMTDQCNCPVLATTIYVTLLSTFTEMGEAQTHVSP